MKGIRGIIGKQLLFLCIGFHCAFFVSNNAKSTVSYNDCVIKQSHLAGI